MFQNGYLMGGNCRNLFFIHAFCGCNVGMDVIYDLMDY